MADTMVATTGSAWDSGMATVTTIGVVTVADTVVTAAATVMGTEVGTATIMAMGMVMVMADMAADPGSADTAVVTGGSRSAR